MDLQGVEMLDNGWLIVCGVLFFVVVFNLGLMLNVLRNRGRQQPFLPGSLSDLLNPWKKEDESLEKLSQQVRDLGETQAPTSDEGRDG
jgi:uncharacterized protein YlxW (UPF0749 family)